MKSPLRTSLILLQSTWLLAAGVPLEAQVFRPSMKVCNRTVSPFNVAIAYDLAGSTRQTTEGWYKVNACTCRTVLQDRPLKATEVFLMASRDGANLLRDARPGLCVKSTAFNFQRENSDPQACAAAGGRPGMFKWFDTLGRGKVVSIRRPGECNLMDDQ